MRPMRFATFVRSILAGSVPLLLMLVLPAVSVLAVNEDTSPICGRWPHGGGSYTAIAYQWGDRLQQPGTQWRDAFTQSIGDWNAAPIKMYYAGGGAGPNTFNTYSAQDGRGGVTYTYCNGSAITSADVLGNVFYDQTDNARRAYAGHEAGHGLGVGHITDPGIALMGNNPDPNTYYTPQSLDIDLFNQDYP